MTVSMAVTVPGVLACVASNGGRTSSRCDRLASAGTPLRRAGVASSVSARWMVLTCGAMRSAAQSAVPQAAKAEAARVAWPTTASGPICARSPAISRPSTMFTRKAAATRNAGGSRVAMTVRCRRSPDGQAGLCQRSRPKALAPPRGSRFAFAAAAGCARRRRASASGSARSRVLPCRRCRGSRAGSPAPRPGPRLRCRRSGRASQPGQVSLLLRPHDFLGEERA
jgi:hypothetical protein